MFQDFDKDDSWGYEKLNNRINTTIKVESAIGIISDSKKYSDISNNLGFYQKYADTLFSNNSDIFNSNAYDNSYLGNRYFLDTKTHCSYNNSQVNKNIVVDGIGFSSDISNVGIIYSAEKNLDMIQPEIIPSSIRYIPDINDTKCVSINLQKSNNVNDVEKNYISINDYNRLKYSAFPNNCKKTTDDNESVECNREAFEIIESNNIFHHNESHNEGSDEGGDGNIVIGDNRYYKGYSNYIDNEKNENDQHNFIPSHLLKYLLYKKDERDNDDNKEINELKKNTNIYLHKDIISSFFLGSITILGLYIIFRMIQRSRE